MAAFLLLATALGLSACGPSLEEIDARIAAAVPTPAFTATPQPAATPQPTPSPVPAPTPQPTATPQPTPTPQPRPTPQRRPTPQPTATPQPIPTPILAANLQRLRESVVRVDQVTSTGSGVIFQVDSLTAGRGYEAFIVTNAHVVDRNSSVSIEVWDESDWEFFTLPGTVLGKDTDLDLAVVHICCDARLSGKAAALAGTPMSTSANMWPLWATHMEETSMRQPPPASSLLARASATRRWKFTLRTPGEPGQQRRSAAFAQRCGRWHCDSKVCSH